MIAIPIIQVVSSSKLCTAQNEINPLNCSAFTDETILQPHHTQTSGFADPLPNKELKLRISLVMQAK